MRYFKAIRLIVLVVILLGVIGATVYGYYPELFMPKTPSQKYGFKEQGLWGKSPAEIKDLCLKSSDMEYVVGCLDAIGRYPVHFAGADKVKPSEVMGAYEEIYNQSATAWTEKEAPENVAYEGFQNIYGKVESKSFSDRVRVMLLRQILNAANPDSSEEIQLAMDMFERVKPEETDPIQDYWQSTLTVSKQKLAEAKRWESAGEGE